MGMLCGVLFLIPMFASARTKCSHLEPLPLIRSNYDTTIFNSLLGDGVPYLYMVLLPSRVPTQSAIIIEERVEYEEYSDEESRTPDFEPKIKSSQWVLKYAAFNNLQRPQHPFNLSQTLNVDPTNDITRLEINIDDDFADLITTAWLHVLRETRYRTERKPSTILDGSTYIFKCNDDQFPFSPYYGITASYSDVKLKELGRILMSLAKADEQDRELLQEQCVELASNIIKKKHPNQSSEPILKTPVE